MNQNITNTLNELKDLINNLKTHAANAAAWNAQDKANLEKRINHLLDKSQPRHTNLTQDLDTDLKDLQNIDKAIGQEKIRTDTEISKLKDEKTNQDWTELAQQRVDNLKTNSNPRLTELEQELNQTVKDATDEITRQETEIKQLKTKLSQSQNRITDLTKQITDYQRAAELRINEPKKTPNSDWWTDYGPIILLLSLYALSTWLLSKKSQEN